MLCRKKPSPVRRKFRKYLAVFLAILILLTVYAELAVKHQLRDVIIRDMQTLSEQAVTMAVDDFLEEHADTGNRMCDIIYNNGSVAAISINAAFVNAAKTYITEHAQDCIDRLSRTQGISVRLGNFTGLVFLSNFGPEIPLTSVPRSPSPSTAPKPYPANFKAALRPRASTRPSTTSPSPCMWIS